MMVPDAGTCGGGGSDSPSFSTTLSPKPVQEPTAAKEEEKVKMGTSPPETCGSCGGGFVGQSSSSSMNTAEVKKAKNAMLFNGVTIKVESGEEAELQVEDEAVDELELEGGGGCSVTNNGSWSSCSSMALPKPMEGLHESVPPPFLKKTFEMVEDPDSDPIVSWSKTHDSFVVWDSHEFSKNLLPKYFKHSNFSSFIRQLNTYGFRKIDPDRWEFANEGFQGGKKYLLKNIKRRSRYSKQQQCAMAGTDSTKISLEAELDCLQNDQDVLRVEILKLRQQQENSQNQLNAVEQRIRVAQCKQLQMFIFFAKVVKNPGIIRQLIQKRKQEGKLDGAEFRKKRRLLPTQVPETLATAADASQCVNCRDRAHEQLATMQTEVTEILPEDIETSCQMSKLFVAPISDKFCGPIDQDRKANIMCKTNAQDMPSVYHMMSEKLLADCSVVEKVDDKDLEVNDSKFYLELEDLIGKPRTWAWYVTELVEHTGFCCINSLILMIAGMSLVFIRHCGSYNCEEVKMKLPFQLNGRRLQQLLSSNWRCYLDIDGKCSALS